MTYALEVPSRIRWGFYTASALLLAALCAFAIQTHAPALASAPEGASASLVPVTPKLERLAHSYPTHRVEVIVQLRRSVAFSKARRMIWSLGGSETGRALHVIRALPATISAQAAYQLAQEPGIHAVTLNGKVQKNAVSIDPAVLATSFNDSVQSPGAWRKPYTGKGVGVAVIDTGIAGDLADFRTSQQNAASRVTVSAVTNPYAKTATDTFGHGTHVAGIIAGNSTNRPSADPLYGKYAGVAPEANLVSVKTADEKGEATVLDVIYGLQFAVDFKSTYNIRVANLSLESSVAQSYKIDPLDAAVESAWLKGIVVVAAAGNRGSALDAVNYAPGNDPYAVSVGAVDDKGTKNTSDDALASWSSRGVTQDGYRKPEVVAPGARIVSNLAPKSAFASMCAACIVDGQYIRAGGTSMSAPMVSGAAAVMLEAYPGMTPNQVKGALIATARNTLSGGQEVSVSSLVQTNVSIALVNQGLIPNALVNPQTGDIDYSRSRWSRSSWSSAMGTLRSSWSRSSWSCNCSKTTSGSVDPSRSSWSRSSWSSTTDWKK
jgi:serine protease AprX